MKESEPTHIKREVSLNDLIFDIGDRVGLPLKEEGIIKGFKNILWGFDTEVEITKGTFNDAGSIVEYRKQDLILL